MPPDTAQFDEILQRTLDDGRLSRTERAATANHENTVLTDDAGPGRAFARTFETLWERFE